MPFVVGVVQHGANEADDGGLVGDDADWQIEAYDRHEEERHPKN